MMNYSSQRIRAIRRMRDLTGAEVAKKVGISAQYYYNIERGRRKLSAELATKLARVFGVTVDFLLGQPHSEGVLSLSSDMYADGYTDESYYDDLEKHLSKFESSVDDESEEDLSGLTAEEKELIILYRQTDKKISDEDRKKLKNTISDTIELYLARTRNKD